MYILRSTNRKKGYIPFSTIRTHKSSTNHGWMHLLSPTRYDLSHDVSSAAERPTKHRSSPIIILSPPGAQQPTLEENHRHVRGAGFRFCRFSSGGRGERERKKELSPTRTLLYHTGNLLRAALELRITIKAHPKPVRVTSSPTSPNRPS